MWQGRRESSPSVGCFNPHTYMRCDTKEDYINLCKKVSIHTPTWGVTEARREEELRKRVSIHTPTWGVTLVTGNWDAFNGGFNPHTYMRCDNGFVAPSSQIEVSIHTPTWGVTLNYLKRKMQSLFQSTHLHEVWHVRVCYIRKVGQFQSTHLHEVWRQPSRSQTSKSCFNPHTYMRCDEFVPPN